MTSWNDYFYVLNTNSGILHTKNCADGNTSNPPVGAGHRKHYSNLDNAREDEKYMSDHKNNECMNHID